MKLHISKDFSLPIDVVTQKLAWMGRTGAGKTYGFLKLAEEMLSAGIQVVILDPVGVHWGLRLAADGKSEGIKSIYVFGGLHADIPLQSSSGKVVADFLADNHCSAIIDLSQFESDAEKTRFATDWADRFFFRWKSKPSPVHVALEECQEFNPQNIMKGEEKMLHAFNRMWKLGRNFGIGGSLISQRPQEVNKKSLNMTECFFAFQMTGPHERKAIESWMQEKGVELTIASDLPKLEVGTAHIWSPQWLKLSQKVKISERWTYNASSTPKFGAKPVEMKPLSQVELDKLTNELKNSIERAKENDPELLKRKIRELENQAKARLGRVDEAPMINNLKGILKEQDKEIASLRKQLIQTNEEKKILLKKIIDRVKLVITETDYNDLVEIKIINTNNEFLQSRTLEFPKKKQTPFEVNVELHKNQSISRTSEEIKLASGAKRLLAALVQWSPNGMTESQMRAHAGLRNSGTYSNYKSSLMKSELIEIKTDGLLYATSLGIEHLGHDIPAPSTTQEVLDVWMPKLSSGAQRMLQILINYSGDYITDDQLRKEAELANSGTYSNYKTQLKTAHLIVIKQGMIAANKETLFL